MQVSARGPIADYLTILRENAAEAQALFADLLISVTTFFRDPPRSRRWPGIDHSALFERRGRQTIRVWVPGCATGEEAYSIAMLLLEEAAITRSGPQIQVFGSGHRLHRAVDRARGPLPGRDRGRCHRGSPARFFTRDGDHYRGQARVARHRAVRQSQPAQGSAVLAHRPDLMPQPADLSGPRTAAAGLRRRSIIALKPGRLPVPRLVRDRRQPVDRFGCSTGIAHLSAPAHVNDGPRVPATRARAALRRRRPRRRRSARARPQARRSARPSRASRAPRRPASLVDRDPPGGASLRACRALFAASPAAAANDMHRSGARGAAVRAARRRCTGPSSAASRA